jgi:hypothetical protein
MVICPIAMAVHCTGCPFFKLCPAKTLLGDYRKEEADSGDVKTTTDEETSKKVEELTEPT